MSTLISVKGGRCNANCYNAKHEKCVCVCQGQNHGVGLDRAVDNTRKMSGELFKKFSEVKLGNDVVQRRLF